MALNADQLRIFFSGKDKEAVYTFEKSSEFLKELLNNAEWPEKSRDKINDYIMARCIDIEGLANYLGLSVTFVSK